MFFYLFVLKGGDNLKQYDLVIIGAGPGGYVSAIRAAQLGLKTAIVEKQYYGGTCLNVGCIPSKLLLEYGKKVHNIHLSNSWGINTGKLDIDYSKLSSRSKKVISQLTGGVEHLLKSNEVDLIKGEAIVHDDLTIHVDDQKLQAKDIILATGSTPFVPPISGLDKVKYHTTDTIFNMQSLPKSLAVIGGGVIATEIASSMADLGVEVSIIEIADDILLTETDEIRSILKAHLESQGINVLTQCNISKVTQSQIELEHQDSVNFDTLLVATGRKSNLQVAENLNLKQSNKGSFIEVDETYQTSIPHLYAVGDLIDSYQLAHAASIEGITAVEAIAGLKPNPVNKEMIPRCIYTRVEAASVGLSQSQAEAQGYQVKTVEAPFQSNAKSMIEGETDGFIQLVIDTRYGEILGGFITGPNATELIGELLGVKVSEGTIEELSQVIQPHPSLLEVMGEAADDYLKKAIHKQ
ncbi:dihydrolipoyl dehydrogenase [Staphylococcus sp. IVB6181]|uniref:dihydrolipoyl dehydrogenase n=1 Tax=Staphylococcus sp. IVB6181 TaxID=2929481 RepID=UPI0021CF342C|nr:dihydrolipoyl dehydrogenase [Staphylococcus sp. IVB6181]UXV35199.1 dihydrolipoyl dehydrogenase [Staphylococcus sp. IVB6181]